MSRAYISVATRRVVASRAQYCCEYCQTQSRLIAVALPLDHITPVVLGGKSTIDNLCLACNPCNSYKADKIRAIDPQTGDEVALFNPRRQKWSMHFAWSDDGVRVIGLTPIGRATVACLKINRVHAIASRTIWVTAGWHPPF